MIPKQGSDGHIGMHLDEQDWGGGRGVKIFIKAKSYILATGFSLELLKNKVWAKGA